MPTQLGLLLDKIKILEEELVEELQKQEAEFAYEIRKRKVYFEANTILQQKKLVKSLVTYLRDAPIGNLISTPFIWSCLFPMLALDIFVSLYQYVCFPIYSIPKVKRGDYVIFDRRFLNYLNILEKLNCAYCSYANGLIGYVQEVAARTEQYWCPIKYARHIKTLHSPYHKFLNYGDAESYRGKIETIRRSFNDLQ